MPPFSVSQLKGSATNFKNSTSQKYQDTKSKFSSKSSATSTYDHRFPATKAPPPLPPPVRRVGQRQGVVEDHGTEDHDADDGGGPPPSHSLPSGPPPVIPRNTKPGQSDNPLLKLNGTQLPSSLNQIKWSQVSQDDKEQLFGWLDEFFGIKHPSSSSSLRLEDTTQSGKPGVGRPQNHAPVDSFKTSHPGETTYGSRGHDLCMYFSSSTHWDSAWYATPTAVPPQLEQRRDVIRSHYTQWRGDMHTLGGGVLFSDMSACWYVVEWSKRNAQDTSQARRRATVLPRPEAMSLDELVAAHETYGETVAAFAESFEGTGRWCARGECWDLASEALKSFEQWDYIPKPIPSIEKTHGHLIYEGKAWGKGQAAGRWRGGDNRIRRGDIVQWLSTTIVDGYKTFTLGDPVHTAVIVRDQIPRITPSDGASMKPGDLVQLEVVEQSVHQAPDRNVYRLEGMTAGELWIYRPVGMEAYLKLLFTPNWPEEHVWCESYKEEKVLRSNLLRFPLLLKAIKSIHRLDYCLTLEHDIKSIPDVEDHAAARVMDFLSLKKVHRRRLIEEPNPSTIKIDHKKNSILKQLQQVNGIGPIKAHVLFNDGCESVGQLHEERFLKFLPKPIQNVFNYEKTLSAGIARKDGEHFMNTLRETLSPEFDIHLADASSRLGHETLKELDILLFHPNYTTLPQVLSEVRIHMSYQVLDIRLISGSFFKESVSDPIKKSGLDVFTYSKSDDQWHALMKIKDKVIGRTRIYLLPMSSKAAALLIFTGNPSFVNYCRRRARKFSLHLNEFGLWRESAAHKKVWLQSEDVTEPEIKWETLPIPDEAALLQRIDMSYIKPDERNIKPNKLDRFSEKPPWHIAKFIPPVLQEVN